MPENQGSTFTDEERKTLESYVTSVDAQVFAVKNFQGMTGAAYARYSRAKGGFREVLLKEFIKEGAVDARHADELIARVLVAFGDDSVGELEGCHVSFEQISMLATKEIEDHRIGGSPIEQSTRYVVYDQKDPRGRWLYYRGSELTENPAFGEQYVRTMDKIFETYAGLVEPMKEYFTKLKPIGTAEYDVNGDGVKEKWADVEHDEKMAKAFKQTYTSDLRTKACDTLRSLLPLSTLTNVATFGNGRFYQTVISHLMTQDLPEFKRLGDEAMAACSEVIPQYVRRAKRNEYDADASRRMYGFTERLLGSGAPEKPASLPSYVLLDRGEAAIANKLSGNASAGSVKTALQDESDVFELAYVLYPYSNVSMDTLRAEIRAMGHAERAKIVEAYVGKRESRRHRPGRGLEAGYEYSFDLVTNWGVYKDLMRHRMNSQQRQLFTTEIGFAISQEIVDAGFEEKVREAVALSEQLYKAIAKIDPVLAQYAVLHGHYVRWILCLNDRAAMHLLELRSGPQGHPNYRLAAQAMHDLIKERSPWRGEIMGYVDHADYYWSRADSEAKQRVQESKLDTKYGGVT